MSPEPTRINLRVALLLAAQKADVEVTSDQTRVMADYLQSLFPDLVAPTRTKPEFCEAVTRKQFEAAHWGDSKIGCGRKAKVWDDRDPAGWFCTQHADPDKRYGVN